MLHFINLAKQRLSRNPTSQRINIHFLDNIVHLVQVNVTQIGVIKNKTQLRWYQEMYVICHFIPGN